MNLNLQSSLGKIRVWGVLVLLTVVFFIFQGNIPAGHVFHDNDPLLDQPTREVYEHFVPPNQQQQFTVTDADGFDNFNVAVDYCEIWAVNNAICTSGENVSETGSK